MVLLITGGCGFIASNFINYFFPIHTGTTIINLDAMYYCASETNIDKAIRDNPRYIFVKGKVQNMELVMHILKTHNVTHVIHFAAQSHVQNSFEHSLDYTIDNVLGTHTLLEACRQWGNIQRFIHVSTDEVYGQSPIDSDVQMNEQSILCPTNPYAATKASAELIAMSYYRSFNIPIIITRGNNVYGPNQYPEKLIPLFIQQLQNGKPVTIQGNGSCVRSFLYVKDVVRAFDIIFSNGVIGEIYNIGGKESDEYSVIDIAKILITKIHGLDAKYDQWIEYIEDRPFNDQRYFINNEKLANLGWVEEYNLEMGLCEILKF